MPIWDVQGAEWQAARSAAIAWASGDCAGFLAAATTMGYAAVRLRDSVTGRAYWVLRDEASKYQGVFAFRDPAEAPTARALVIDSPHFGFDFQDDRALRLFRDVDAVALLQNTAHRCSLLTCSGCTQVANYSCEGACSRDSDVVHAMRNGYMAVYDGLEAARDDWHFEYHGSAVTANVAGCTATAHISQASTLKLTAQADDGTYPNRFWRALDKSLGPNCTCYHQREDGCALAGSTSTAGRRTNLEASPNAQTLQICTNAPNALSGRFLHFEAYGVTEERVAAALIEALPRP